MKLMCQVDTKIGDDAWYKKDSVLDKMYQEKDNFLKQNFPEITYVADFRVIPMPLDKLAKTQLVTIENGKRSGMFYFNEQFLMASLLMNDYTALIDTLKHELVHYSMFVQGKGFKDGDKDFEAKLKELNISSNSDGPNKFNRAYLIKDHYKYINPNTMEYVFDSFEPWVRQKNWLDNGDSEIKEGYFFNPETNQNEYLRKARTNVAVFQA